MKIKELREDSHLVSLVAKRTENAKWPIDCVSKYLDDFDEILVLAKKKGQESYVRFSSTFRSTFWWIGVLEAMKSTLMDESLTLTDQEE